MIWYKALYLFQHLNNKYHVNFFNSCRGTDIDNEVGVGSAEECLDLCEVEDGCSYATYFGDSGACVLLEDCTDLETCDDCTTSGVQACGDGGNGEQSSNLDKRRVEDILY